MTNRINYISESKDYADAQIIAAFSQMNDVEFEKTQEIYTNAVGDNDIAFDISSIVFSNETLEHFEKSAKNWNECASVEAIENGLYFDGVQINAGMQRIHVVVINLGNRRVVLKS